MQYTDEQIQKMLELKESIIDKMAKHQDELDFLQKNLDILDVVLKGSSLLKPHHYQDQLNQLQKNQMKKKLKLKKKNQNLFKLKKIKMEKLLLMHL